MGFVSLMLKEWWEMYPIRGKCLQAVLAVFFMSLYECSVIFEVNVIYTCLCVKWALIAINALSHNSFAQLWNFEVFESIKNENVINQEGVFLRLWIRDFPSSLKMNEACGILLGWRWRTSLHEAFRRTRKFANPKT